MEQRRPRLGDIVDDYCPRERRVTNHAVVAMIEDKVKQTRCTTCDADHDYKHARIPPQRKKKEASALDGPFTEDVQVRAITAEEEIDGAVAESPLDAREASEGSSGSAGDADADTDAAADTDAMALDAASEEGASARVEDDGPVHRRLIRATLPRQEGQVPERREPDFTIRQPGRGGRFDGDGSGNGSGGNRPRHQRGGGGRGQFAGSGGGNGPQRFGGGQRPQRQGGGGQQQNGNGNSAGGGRQGGGGGRRRGR